MFSSINFRDCEWIDIPNCTSICAKAFPFKINKFTEDEIRNIMKADLDISYLTTNYHELAI